MPDRDRRAEGDRAGRQHGEAVTFDLNADAAQAIEAGKIEFSIDQQPYVQGYMAVTSLYLYMKNGNDIGGGKPVLTGPSFVDKTNIDKILRSPRTTPAKLAGRAADAAWPPPSCSIGAA